MKKQVQRALATAAATAVLALTGGVLATPAAAADADVDVLGGTATAVLDGVLRITALDAPLVDAPNPIAGAL
ncbi:MULTISPECIES: hypothetical protein [Streptomyces]|uniref:Secreted protein n=1 Tax=Streptomyces morookaense TaxID=1970 RepID=A0A7Y7E5Z9_STRMO|nr:MULTISPECIES: hypothetical protein [Streptomyces]MCC2278633.1 hypothetical protein [Streptomyces sp. ET3-23]NVK77355.1 hypothetical protein [Streptomyces morookaense]GHF18635.1 hypothetical protein GCM10010359_20390 [Streptomyces morookaense]